MSINWFPGHMVAASDKAKQAMAEHDVVIEVLDARCPGASANPSIERMRMGRQRPALKVLNKADIADPAVTSEWLAWFNAQKNTSAIAISSKKPGEAQKVLAAARKLAPHRDAGIGAADFTKALRMLIMGVPNVGKSTLINALLGKKSAKTGDEPAVTKVLHRYDLGRGMWLTDTPGLMWPHIKQPADGLMLAASHIIGANAYFESDAAGFLGDVLLARYPKAVAERYKVIAGEPGVDGIALVETIAKKRGYLRNGEADFDRAAIALLADYRGGALGRISLESPESRQAMLAKQAQEADGDALPPEEVEE
jgi:ribosome biogenesis GTPase A